MSLDVDVKCTCPYITGLSNHETILIHTVTSTNFCNWGWMWGLLWNHRGVVKRMGTTSALSSPKGVKENGEDLKPPSHFSGNSTALMCIHS